MNNLMILFAAAILTEGIWEILKNFVSSIPSVNEKTMKLINVAGALLIGILIAVLTDTNIFLLLDIEMKWPAAGVVLTGILISRGSNYVHDLMKKLEPKDENIF